MTPPRDSAARVERATAPAAGTVAARALAREAAARASSYRAAPAPAAAPAPRSRPARPPKPRTRPAPEPPKRRRARRSGEPELNAGSAQPRRVSRPARTSYYAPPAPRPRTLPREQPPSREPGPRPQTEPRPRPQPQLQPRLRRTRANAPLPVRLLGGLLHNPLLDRLTKGRVCIGVVAFALVGIVGMNLLQLPLNTDIGAALARQQTLSQQNSALRLEISSLTATDRIEALASKLGMVPSAPGAIRFLDAGRAPSAAAVRAALARPVAATGATGQSGPAAGAA